MGEGRGRETPLTKRAVPGPHVVRPPPSPALPEMAAPLTDISSKYQRGTGCDPWGCQIEILAFPDGGGGGGGVGEGGGEGREEARPSHSSLSPLARVRGSHSRDRMGEEEEEEQRPASTPLHSVLFTQWEELSTGEGD